jgi:hypothetical protein
LDLWSFGTQVIRIPSEEFWSLTFEEYFAREDRFFETEKRKDLRFGAIISTIANWSGKQLKEGAPLLTAESIFGHEASKETQEDVEMTPEQTIAHVKAMFAGNHQQTQKNDPIFQGSDKKVP